MAATLHHGDCLDVMRSMDEASVDTVITDPPYGLEFMGKDWDHGIPGGRFWSQAWRVAKPGALLLTFGGTRTYHRLACAIEDAGWEIRDCMMWLYGSGFPKSHDISKGIDRAAGAEREVVGVDTHAAAKKGNTQSPYIGNCRNGEQSTDGWRNRRMDVPKSERGPFNKITNPATDLAQQWHGYGTALKPAWEPIIVAMKPLDDTFAHNAETHGVAGMWIDGARVASRDAARAGNTNKSIGAGYGVRTWHKSGTTPETGRWPANVILDEDAGAMLDEQSGVSKSSNTPRVNANTGWCINSGGGKPIQSTHNDTGGASRFFYCAKASRSERGNGNNHPTVKPLKLMQYLARLTKTPTGGVVLDPFMGSGTTGVACIAEGREFIGIEKDAEYIKIAQARIDHAEANPKQVEMIF